MDSITIVHSTIKEKPVTSICIGSTSGDLPKHLMTGEKACGYIVKDSVLIPWYWQSISDRDGHRFLVFDRLAILPFSEINRSLRSRALSLLRDLAVALQKVPSGFVQPTNGFIETWRIFFLEEGGFLLLPNSLSQLMLYSTSEKDRFLHLGRYFKPNMEPPFGLCHQFTQFLYQALTGFAPFEDPDVREDQWRHVPLSLGFTSLEASSAKWIDHVLAMDSRTQRMNVSAAYSAEENLSWWLKETANVTWPNLEEPKSLADLEKQNQSVQDFRTNQKKRAARSRFWRKRGALVVTIVVGTLILFAAVGPIVYKQLQPPYTAGMAPTQIIEEFFEAQNDLDLPKMEASLARRTRNPYESEVSGMFVSTRVRQAYEGTDLAIRADTWLEQGKPAIPESSIIYGLISLDIAQIDEVTFRATYHTLSPTFEEEAESIPEVMVVTEMLHVTDFVFTDVKGYWQITEIRPIEVTPIKTIQVQTYPKRNPLAPPVPMG